MDTRNATTIKLALDAVDLEILCSVLNEAMSKNTVDRRQHYQLARNLLDGGDMPVVLQ
jgi:hypothetical protein